jgi:hypothetical protein
VKRGWWKGGGNDSLGLITFTTASMVMDVRWSATLAIHSLQHGSMDVMILAICVPCCSDDSHQRLPEKKWPARPWFASNSPWSTPLSKMATRIRLGCSLACTFSYHGTNLLSRITVRGLG